MWNLQYINGYGDLIQTKCKTLDDVYLILAKEYQEQGGAPFKLKWKIEGNNDA